MVICHNIHECPVRFNAGACQQRFCNDRCPHTQLGEKDEEMPQQPIGDVSDKEPE